MFSPSSTQNGAGLNKKKDYYSPLRYRGLKRKYLIVPLSPVAEHEAEQPRSDDRPDRQVQHGQEQAGETGETAGGGGWDGREEGGQGQQQEGQVQPGTAR